MHHLKRFCIPRSTQRPRGQGYMWIMLNHFLVGCGWVEIAVTHTATSEATIEGLRHMFSTHGVPDTLVSDNGSCFTSEQFANFCNRNSITHITSAPFHPASNGLAERAVQTFKAKLKQMKSGSLTTKIARILLRQHITPHSTTGMPP